MKLTNQEKIYLNQQMDLLVNDPELAAIRYRASNWVNAQLEGAMIAKIQADHGLSMAQWEAFLSGQDPAFKDVKQMLLDTFSFSDSEQKELRLLEKGGQPLNAIAARMKEYLMKKERVAFRERAGITATAWQRFINVSGYTSDDVIDKIINALDLTEEEAAFFRTLVFHDTFSTTDDFKKYVRKLIEDKKREDKKFSVSQFLLNAELSENAWEPFRTNPKDLPTSQATLLKIILGLQMDRPGGRELLHQVNSDFVMRRDLAALICINSINSINSRILKPENYYYILDFFAKAPGGRPYYRNLFSDPDKQP